MSARSRRSKRRRGKQREYAALKNAHDEQERLSNPPVRQKGEGILVDDQNMASDANMVAKMISLGVVDEEVANAVLKRAFVFAAKADDERKYASVMRVVLEAAKLKQKRQLMDGPQRHIHLHSQLPASGNNGPGTINERRKMLAQITAKLGIPDLAQRCLAGEII